MRPWSAIAVLCASCAVVHLPRPVESSCVGEYRWMDGPHDEHHGYYSAMHLSIDDGGTYQYRYSYEQVDAQEHRSEEGRWAAIPGGVVLRGGGDLPYRLILVGDGVRAYLLDYRWLREACVAQTRPSLDRELSRAATGDEPRLPSFDEVCAAL